MAVKPKPTIGEDTWPAQVLKPNAHQQEKKKEVDVKMFRHGSC